MISRSTLIGFSADGADRLRNLRHALDGLQHRLEVLLLAIVRHRTVGVCRLRLDARTYRVGVNDSYVASSLPESLEVNVLRPLGEGLRSVLPMVASKLLSMALNEALNGVLDFLLEQRIMFNFSVSIALCALSTESRTPNIVCSGIVGRSPAVQGHGGDQRLGGEAQAAVGLSAWPGVA